MFNKKVYKLISDIENFLSKEYIGDWNYKFLHDIQSKLIDGSHVTEKQINLCKRIISETN